MRLLLVLVVCGCGGGKSIDTAPVADPTGPPPSACGEVTDGYAVRIEGAVELQGERVSGADVVLVEKLWSAGQVHGTATTAADGTFVLEATDLVSVEDCWGTALDYKAEVVWDVWSRSRDMNAPLYAAIVGDGVADLLGDPIELDAGWIPPLDTGP
ncbi:MAG: hypothetical protein ACI9K2_000140 [Myxococcota bacterium]|jgi:hypothetical protein